MSKAESFLIGVMAPPSCRSAAGRTAARQDLKSGATGPSSQQALRKEASSSCCSSRRAHTEPCIATSLAATIPYRRPPTTTPTPTSTTAPQLERPHQRYVRLITPVFAVLLALTVSPAWAQTLTFSRSLAQTDAWTVLNTSCEVVRQIGPEVYRIAMSGTITAHIDLRSITVIGDVDGDVIGVDRLSDMEAGESQDFSVEGTYSGSLEGVRCGYEVNAVGSVTTAPDLVADTPTVSDNSPAAGASITLSTRVRNRGDGASGSTTLRLYRSTNATISSSDTELKAWSVAALSAGGRTVLVSHQSSAPSTAGTYYYGACVAAVTGESDTGNNCSSSVTVTVSPPPPDLAVDTPTVSDNSPAAGASITLSTRVRNRGDGASGSTTLRLYRSTNATISSSDTELKAWSVAALPAGGRTVLVSHQSSAPSTAGTYYYGACVAAVTGESDTGNNCSSSVTVTVSPPPPDLAVDAPTVSDNSPVAGASFTLRATVRNRGSGTSGSTTLRYYRSTDASISSSDTEVGTDAVGGLSASATSAESISLTAPSAGTYYYGACVAAVTGESDTGNNCSSSVQVTVSPPPPDLAVDAPTVSDNSPVAGASFTLSATVRNRGSGASGSTTLRYYRSTDATISTSDTEVGTDAVSGLSASGTSAESISLTAPSAGTYYYGACVAAVTGESDTGNNCSSSVQVTVSPPPPDLAVDAPTVSDNSPVAGASFTLSATVRNRGSGASGSTTLRYYRSTDATISTSDTEVGTDAVSGLSASGTSAESISLTAPSAGTYYYGACVAAVTGESDTGNNCSSSVQVTVSPVPTAPDLVVGSPTVSDNSPVAGASFTLRATVRNRGSGTSGSTTLRYYRSTNATISTSDTEVGTDAVGGLSASGTSAESISLTAPSAGTYYYGACVEEVTGESDTGNNCSSSVQVTVSPPPPDLAVDAPTVSDNSPVAGASFTLRATVRNRGSGASGSTTLRYYRSTDASISTSDTEVGTDAVGGLFNFLSASATSAESISLTAPSAGTYYYGACVDAVTGESDTGNNCSSSVQVTVSPVPTTPDLAVDAPSVTNSNPTAGASFTLSATVRNRGSGTSGSTTLRYYRSTDASISSSDTEVGTDAVGGLSASATSAESISLTAPSAGTYYYGACVAAVTGESATGNNCSSSVQVTVSPVPTAPDLVVGSPTVSDNSPVAGASFTLRATVRNRGDGASGSTTLRYYRSTDASISSSDTEVGTDAVSGLSASATSAESISLTAPSSTGTYYYGACVAAVTGESDTGNNCSSSVRVTVSPVPTAPDLVVGSPTASDNSPAAGASFTLSATVRNQGNGASGSTTLRYYRSTDASISTSDTEVGTDAVGGLSASATSAESISLTASSSAGTYYYGACVEAVTGESATGNNCSSSVAVTVSPVPTAPDLVVGSPTASDNSPAAGSSFTLSATVRNRGDGASGSTTLRYYRSTDATISSSDTEVGTDPVNGLSASATSAESISLTAPSAGTYYYGACVAAVTGESDTGNNCSSSVTVTVSPVPTAPDLAVDAPSVTNSNPTAGSSFTLRATVRNRGDGASGSTTLRYYRSTNATISSSDTEVGTDAVGGLSASGTSAESISLTAPSAGTYYYGACVAAVTGESGTGNNCSSSVTVTVSPVPTTAPDLVVGSPTVSDNSPVAGGSFTLSATVRNRGDGASGSTTLRYYRSTDATISTSDTEVGTDAVGGLSASGTSAESISLTAPSAGTYYYGACVAAVTGESDTGNNCSSSVTVTVSPVPTAPDLVATDAQNKIDLTWSAPSGNGGSAITAYDLRYIRSDAPDKADANWTVVEDVWSTGSGALTYELTGLSGGTQYDVQVRAVNGSGDGPWSATATGTPEPETQPTDFDGDGKTDLVDFFRFVDAYGGTDARFDLDGSGKVDFVDFFKFVDAFGS